MDTHDHGRKVYLLLALGAFVTALAGGIVGYGTRHSVVPWKAPHIATAKNDLSLDVYAKEPKNSQDIDKNEWPNLSLPLVSPYEAKNLQPDQEYRLRSNR